MATKTDTFADRKCFTHEFRVVYPAIFEAQAFEGEGEKQDPKFGVTMLFDKSVDLGAVAQDSILSMKRVVANAKREKWGPKEKWPSGLRSPFRDGDTKSDRDGFEGTIFVKADAKENRKPGVAGPNGKELKDPTAIYAGCYARALLLASAYDTKGNKGVKFTVLAIQKTRDGDRLESGGSVEGVFTAVQGAASDSDDDSDGYDL